MLDRIYQFVNPDDVCPILPFPAADPRRPDRLIEEYAAEMQSVWEVEPRDVVYADEKNPVGYIPVDPQNSHWAYACLSGSRWFRQSFYLHLAAKRWPWAR